MLKNIPILAILLVCGCLSQDELFFSTDELSRLLASDSSKTWVLRSRLVDNVSVIQDCELDDELTLVQATNPIDTARMIFTTGSILCPNQMDSIIYSGIWEVLDTDSTHVVQFVIENDTSTRTINYITSLVFQMTYLETEKSIVEEFVALD